MIKFIKATASKVCARIKVALHQCPQCRSFETVEGNWLRGWNNMSRSGYSDRGMYCIDCSHIDWDTPLEQHVESLPAGCIPNQYRIGQSA